MEQDRLTEMFGLDQEDAITTIVHGILAEVDVLIPQQLEKVFVAIDRSVCVKLLFGPLLRVSGQHHGRHVLFGHFDEDANGHGALHSDRALVAH